eukprot:g3321.t1
MMMAPTGRTPRTRSLVHSVSLAQFDELVGNTLAVSFPAAPDPEITSHDKAALAELCLPDGAHQFSSDWTYQLLEGAGSTPLFGVACFRNRPDATQKRGAHQFAMLIVSFEPHFDFFKPFLEAATEEFMARVAALGSDDRHQSDAVAAEVLGTLYHAINEGFRDTVVGQEVSCAVKLWGRVFRAHFVTLDASEFSDASLRSLVLALGVDAMRLWYSLLHEHRLLFVGKQGVHAAEVGDLVLAAPLLVAPLHRFFSGDVTPYVSLADLAPIMKPRFVCGTTSSIMATKSTWYDTLIEVDPAPPQGAGAAVTKVDARFRHVAGRDMQFIRDTVRGAEDGRDEAWVRARFFEFTAAFLHEATAHASGGRGGTPGSSPEPPTREAGRKATDSSSSSSSSNKSSGEGGGAGGRAGSSGGGGTRKRGATWWKKRQATRGAAAGGGGRGGEKAKTKKKHKHNLPVRCLAGMGGALRKLGERQAYSSQLAPTFNTKALYLRHSHDLAAIKAAEAAARASADSAAAAAGAAAAGGGESKMAAAAGRFSSSSSSSSSVGTPTGTGASTAAAAAAATKAATAAAMATASKQDKARPQSMAAAARIAASHAVPRSPARVNRGPAAARRRGAAPHQNLVGAARVGQGVTAGTLRRGAATAAVAAATAAGAGVAGTLADHSPWQFSETSVKRKGGKTDDDAAVAWAAAALSAGAAAGTEEDGSGESGGGSRRGGTVVDIDTELGVKIFKQALMQEVRDVRGKTPRQARRLSMASARRGRRGRGSSGSSVKSTGAHGAGAGAAAAAAAAAAAGGRVRWLDQEQQQQDFGGGGSMEEASELAGCMV